MHNRLDKLIDRYPQLQVCREDIKKTFEIFRETYCQRGKLLICGNGGSCADAEHIVGELMKGFCKKRSIPLEVVEKLKEIDSENGQKIADILECGLPAIALSSHTALNTAFSNDKDADFMYAQEVMGYGEDRDTLLGISTSGNAKNVLYAMEVAKAKGLRTVALTGKDGGCIKTIADAAIVVPSYETYEIQELHLPIYHTLCLMLEDTFF